MSIITNRTAMGTMNLMFQNGVGDGAGLSSPQIPMGSSRDSINGGVGDSPKRPSKLSVLTPKVCMPKAKQEDSGDMEDRSLPCTPETHSVDGLDASGCPAGDEAAVDIDTRLLISIFIAEITGISRPQWRESRALTTMKRVVGDLMEKHTYAYKGMMNKLAMEDRGDDVAFVGLVAKSMFEDGNNNWGRVASLVTFGAVVAQYMKQHGRRECVEQVAQEISTYLLTDQRDWLIKNNAWDGFVEFFQVPDPESTVRNVLMAVAGVAGIGATLALLIR